MNDLTFLPAVQMAEQIRHRKISPVELVEAHLRKIKKLNPVLNAFVQVDAEGASIDSGMSAAGVGSDGGGSIRVPAHFSGICGLKPTPGRIPATGHFPNSVGPFALIGVVGPMARKVQDLKLFFEVMQGPDIGDPSAVSVPVRWPDRDELKKVPIGYFEDDGRTPVTADTRAAVRTAAEALTRAGFQVEPFRPDGLELARQLWWKFFGIAGGMCSAR